MGFVAEAVRRGLPGSPHSQYMHAHHPVPSLLKECLPGRLGVRRDVTHSPVKLSFGLCEQVGISILALGLLAFNHRLPVAGGPITGSAA